MASVLIPLTNDGYQLMELVLNAKPLRLTVWRQVSDGDWYYSLEGQDGVSILDGWRMVEGNVDLLAGVTPDLLAGELTVRGSDAPLGASPWGIDHYLVYDALAEI